MKNKFLLLLIIIAITVGISGGLVYNSSGQLRVKTLSSSPSQTITLVPISVPITIQIPTLNVDASIESVGLDSQKRMDVPKDFKNTGWYNLGPKPGEIGNAVIDGHVDTPTGAPSVFYKLKTLTKGNSITIVDNSGEKHMFIVTKIVSYPVESFPIQTVFGPTNQRNLNLITCGGIWDKNKKEYTERTVVFSTLQ